MVRPERIELPTSWFVAKRSIQLSYGRISTQSTVRFLELYRNQNDSPNFGIPLITGKITKIKAGSVQGDVRLFFFAWNPALDAEPASQYPQLRSNVKVSVANAKATRCCFSRFTCFNGLEMAYNMLQ